MMTEKLQNAINEQITAEMWSANLYLAMSFYMEKEGWCGMSHWLKKQWMEENEHACAMADFVIKRGGKATVDKIDVVPNDFGTPLEVFEQVYKHECRVSEMIDNLVDVASAEKDKATQDFLWETIAFAAFLLENDHLVTLYKGSEYFTHYFCAFYGGGAYLNVTIGISEENAVKLNLVTFFNGFAEIMNIQELLGFCLELLSLDFYNCVHCLNNTLLGYSCRRSAIHWPALLQACSEKLPTKLQNSLNPRNFSQNKFTKFRQ